MFTTRGLSYRPPDRAPGPETGTGTHQYFTASAQRSAGSQDRDTKQQQMPGDSRLLLFAPDPGPSHVSGLPRTIDPSNTDLQEPGRGDLLTR